MSRFSKFKLWLTSVTLLCILASPVSAQQLVPKMVPCWPAEQVIQELSAPPYSETPLVQWFVPGTDDKILGMLMFNKETGTVSVIEVSTESGVACAAAFGEKGKTNVTAS